MGHIFETHDDAIGTSTRSVGCVAALLPRISPKKAITNWYTKRRQENTAVSAVPDSKAEAEGKSARHVPFILEIGETPLDPVTTPILDADDAWSEMARRFHDAHQPATRAASDGNVPTSAQRNARAAIGAGRNARAAIGASSEVGRTASE